MVSLYILILVMFFPKMQYTRSLPDVSYGGDVNALLFSWSKLMNYLFNIQILVDRACSHSIISVFVNQNKAAGTSVF